MAVEIERKFLLKNDDWKSQVSKQFEIKQGYLSTDKNKVVRIRTKNDNAFLTIKGATENISRKEFEYEIPLEDAIAMLSLCENVIEKTRFIVLISNHEWEIDVFQGSNQGLSLAEIELQSENESFEKPAWLGEEVSHDERYFNAYLSLHPFKNWK